MKLMRNLSLVILLCITSSLHAQNFNGILTYEAKVIPHLGEEYNLTLKDPSGGKKDSIKVAINDSALIQRMKRKGQWVDSLRIVYGDQKLKKTYFKKDTLEYVFDFEKGLKYTHTPKYHCIDTVAFKLTDYSADVKVVKSDSIIRINNFDTQKYTVSLKNYLFFDLYVAKSEYTNMADGFVVESINNLLFSNLDAVKSELKGKLIVHLRYYTKLDKVDFVYTLSSIQKESNLENEFIFPNYEYCYWDTLNDKKLQRKHRKKMKKKKKRKQKS